MQDEIHTNTILNGRYQVQQVLARGGMGAVYLAWDTQHRRQVAIKLARLADPEARAQFRREAGYLQRLSHHSLPRVWDVFSDTQRDFLVMEYIPGDNLEERVRRAGKQPEWLVLRWADELLDALNYLHNQNPPIIHRDIKPSNLKLRKDETLVLVDFGIAKEYLPDVHTQTGATAVSPGYSPLEQYSNRAITDARSDLYALGATLYFLLTGMTPPSAPDRASGDKTLAPIRQVAPDVQPASQMLVQRAVQIHREERWASAADMRIAAEDASSLLAAKDPKAKAAAKKQPKREAVPKPAKPKTTRRLPNEFTKWLVIGVVALALLFSLVGLADSLGVLGRQPGAAAAPTVQAATATAPHLSSPPPSPTPALLAAVSVNGDTLVNLTVEPSEPPAVETPANLASEGGLAATNPTSTAIVLADEATSVVPPTSTPAPRRSPTRAPATATPAPAATQKVEPTQPSVPAVAPTVQDVSVTLLAPLSGEASSGVTTFRWRTSADIASPQALELVVWRPGQDPMATALGLVPPLRQQVVDSAVNLSGISWLTPGEYQWGVLLVETSPYKRLKLASEGRPFRIESSGGGGALPAPTPASTPACVGDLCP